VFLINKQVYLVEAYWWEYQYGHKWVHVCFISTLHCVIGMTYVTPTTSHLRRNKLIYIAYAYAIDFTCKIQFY